MFQLTSPYYMKNSNDLVAFLNQSQYKVRNSLNVLQNHKINFFFVEKTR